MKSKKPYLNYKKLFSYTIKWSFLSIVIGSLVGSISAFFLLALRWATHSREMNLWLILLLPIAGLAIGYVFHFFGKNVEKGNDLVLEEYYQSKKTIPLKMAPLVLFGTIATHLFGGSAGREGTAVQIGVSIADQFKKLLKLNQAERKILLIMGISAGFAAVFGTPVAAFVFSIEVLNTGKIKYKAVLPSLAVAYIADLFCATVWQVPHTHYYITEVAQPNFQNCAWAVLVGIAFGLTSMSFSYLKAFFKKSFKKINFPPLRPFLGGIGIAAFVFAIGSTKYIGLGVPVIEASFNATMLPYDFAIKVMITAFTLGAGFKGGEVTSLFFMGATLGSALFLVVPLPLSLLAGMGFVAVFAGATNTPLASIAMGLELFGWESGIFISIACLVAYLSSGNTSVYASQKISFTKNRFYEFLHLKKHTLNKT